MRVSRVYMLAIIGGVEERIHDSTMRIVSFFVGVVTEFGGMEMAVRNIPIL